MSSSSGGRFAALIARARATFAITANDAALEAQLARSVEVDSAPAADAAADDLPLDLVLAAACLVGDEAAIARFDREYADELRALVRSIAGDAAPDAVQDIWTRLLVATDERPIPRLAYYTGRGSLRTWLRVVAAREAVSLVRKRREVVVDDDVVFGRLVETMDPGLALIRARSAREVKRAFEEAVSSLTVRERNLLRQHLLDGMTIDDLAGLYHVHRATAARWLGAARDEVWNRTQRALRERLALTPTELASLLGAVRECLDLSIERVLG